MRNRTGLSTDLGCVRAARCAPYAPSASVLRLVLGVLFVCAAHSANAFYEPPKRAKFVSEASWINLSQQVVRKKLRRAEVLEFKNVFFSRSKYGNPFACGEVRYRTVQGDLKRRRFLSAGRSEVTFVEGEVRHFESGWRAFCRASA